MTGYWKRRGFFDAYVRGRWIGRFADPDDAQKAIDRRWAGKNVVA
jgi:hypothetical protein